MTANELLVHGHGQKKVRVHVFVALFLQSGSVTELQSMPVARCTRILILMSVYYVAYFINYLPNTDEVSNSFGDTRKFVSLLR